MQHFAFVNGMLQIAINLNSNQLLRFAILLFCIFFSFSQRVFVAVFNECA